MLLLLIVHYCAVSSLAQQPGSDEKRDSHIGPSKKSNIHALAMVETLTNRNPVRDLAGPLHTDPIFDKKYN